MPDGSKWDVPAQIIAENRARYYACLDADEVPSPGSQDESTYDNELDYALKSNSELRDWASNNMNWSDVEKHAVRFNGADAPDFQEGWVNGDKEIVSEP